LGTGGTNEQLQAVITGSPEYFQKSGATNDGCLNALYEDALGRAIDPSGEAEFIQALVAGMSPVQVAATIFSSSEHRLATFIGDLRGVSGEEVIAAIVGSQEYFQRAQL